MAEKVIKTNDDDDDKTKDKEIIKIYNEFDQMGLSDELIRGIYGYGFEKPSPIQQKAIVPVINKRDITAQSNSGTGKTGAFVIGTCAKINQNKKTVQAVILAPTRELGEQIYNVVKRISHYTKITSMLLIGGTSVRNNIKDLQSNPHIVVGTPGRCYDMLKRIALKTNDVHTFILDEADEMLSKGFKEQIYEIFQYIPNNCNVGLFSATLPDECLEITNKFMNNPVQILVKRENVTLEGIKQFFIPIEKEPWKLTTLCDLYSKLTISQSIVYCNSKRKADYLKEQLLSKDFTVACLHADLKQNERREIMERFRSGDSRVLIATDIIARGIDVQQVSIVINYDIPKTPENFTHRVGRSGRYGRKGIAIHFVTYNDVATLKEIEAYYKIEIEEMPEDIEQFIN